MSITPYNPETGDHTTAVERRVSVPIAGQRYEFSVWCSRYTSEHLTQEDWVAAGRRLNELLQQACEKAARTGAFFLPTFHADIRKAALDTMNSLIYERFKDRQRQAGNMAYQVDSLLAGEEYRV